MADKQPSRAGYELSDLSPKLVVLFGAALVGVGMTIHVLIWLLYLYFGHAAAATSSSQYPVASGGSPQLPPAPMLQVKPREELKQIRAEEDDVLGSYAWVDRNAGVVRIPIERAMALVVGRGLPVRSPNTGAAAGAIGNAGGAGTASTAKQGAAKEPVRE